MIPGKKYKGIVTSKYRGNYVVDLFNDQGVFDLLEDIDPVILDLSDYPVISEGAIIEFGKDQSGEFNILTIQAAPHED